MKQHVVSFVDVGIFAQCQDVLPEHLGITLHERNDIEEIRVVNLTKGNPQGLSTLGDLERSAEDEEEFRVIDPRKIYIIAYRISSDPKGKVLVRLGTRESLGNDVVLYHFHHLRFE